MGSGRSLLGWLSPRRSVRWVAALVVALGLFGCTAPRGPLDLAPEAICWGDLDACAGDAAAWTALPTGDAPERELAARTYLREQRVVLRFPLAAASAGAIRVVGGSNARRLAFDGAPRRVAYEGSLAPGFVAVPERASFVLVESHRGLSRGVRPVVVSQGTTGALAAQTAMSVLVPSMLACWCAVVAVLQLVAAIDRRSRAGSLLVALMASAFALRFVVVQRRWTTWWTEATVAWAYAIELASIAIAVVAAWAFYRRLAPGLPWRRYERLFVGAGGFLALAAFVAPRATDAEFLVARGVQLFALAGCFVITEAVFRAIRDLPSRERAVVVVGVVALVSTAAVDLFVVVRGGVLFFDVGFAAFGFVAETTCQAVVMAMRSRRAHDRVDELALELEGANVTLHRVNDSLAESNAKLLREGELLEAELGERRRLQGELERAADRLTQAETMATLGTLMAGIAHDLRNPLNYVTGAVEVLRSALPVLGSADGAERAKSVERVGKAVRWVEQGTASMNALSLAMRNQSRNGNVELSLVDVAEVVTESLLLCGSRTKLCELEVDAQSATVLADPTSVGQLIMNLVSNAADALLEAREIDPDRPTKLRVSARVEGDRFVLVVEDSGPGIPDELRERILEPFFTTKPRGVGTGLGLAIVQRVIEQHRGTLEVGRSDRLGGARFEASWNTRGKLEELR